MFFWEAKATGQNPDKFETNAQRITGLPSVVVSELCVVAAMLQVVTQYSPQWLNGNGYGSNHSLSGRVIKRALLYAMSILNAVRIL